MSPASPWLALAGCLLVAACASTPRALPPGVPPPPSLSGWVPLADAARQAQAFPASWRACQEGVRLKTPRHTLRLFANSRRMEVDGVTVWLNAPLTAHPPGSSRFYLSPPDADDLAALHAKPATRLPQTAHRKYLTVMLDAGHGGDDSGAVSSRPRQQEKELVLDLARRVAAILTRAPVQVVFTRDSDFTLPLDLRMTLAANAPADCLVSLHANFAANAQAVGVETYLVPAAGYAATAGGNTPTDAAPGNRFERASFTLAYAVHRRLHALGIADRGIKRARYHVLRNAPCPAILVEVGFLSNAEESARLASDAHRQRLAEAIAAGIRAYAE